MILRRARATVALVLAALAMLVAALRAPDPVIAAVFARACAAEIHQAGSAARLRAEREDASVTEIASLAPATREASPPRPAGGEAAVVPMVSPRPNAFSENGAFAVPHADPERATSPMRARARLMVFLI